MRYTEKELKTKYETFSEYLNSIFELLVFSPFRLVNEISKKVVFLEKGRIEKLFLTTIGIASIAVFLECIINFSLKTLNLFSGTFPIVFQIISIASIAILYGFVKNYKSSIPPEIEKLLYDDSKEISKESNIEKSHFTKNPFVEKDDSGVKDDNLAVDLGEGLDADFGTGIGEDLSAGAGMGAGLGAFVMHGADGAVESFGESDESFGGDSELDNSYEMDASTMVEENPGTVGESNTIEKNPVTVEKNPETDDDFWSAFNEKEIPVDPKAIVQNGTEETQNNASVQESLDQYDCAGSPAKDLVNPELLNNQEVINYKNSHEQTVQKLKERDATSQNETYYTRDELNVIQKMCDKAIQESTYLDNDFVEVALKSQDFDSYSQVDSFLKDDELLGGNF